MADKFVCGRYVEDTGGSSVFNIPEPTLREDGTCSYCGSLSEELFFECVEKGVKVTPTDKNYKAYVAAPGITCGKFYFQHLSEEGKHKFVQLMNERKFVMEYPGYFYTLPFFVTPA